MTGTKEQPSREPPTQKETNRHPSHRKTSVEKDDKALGEEGVGEKMAERTFMDCKNPALRKLNAPMNHMINVVSYWV